MVKSMSFNGWIGLLGCLAIMACNNSAETSATKATESADSTAYIGPHHEHHKTTMMNDFTTEGEWDEYNKYNPTATSHTHYERDSAFKTFGWHLYSKGTAYQEYDFSTLWGIAYFSYIVDPSTGSYSNIHEWKTTAMVDSAKAHNCKVFLSVANFGAKDNKEFLKNPKAQDVLIDSLVALLRFRNADGVNIDFEGVPGQSATQFTEFVTKLSKGLKAQNPDWIVTLALYTVDYHKIFDIKAIDPYVDLYTLMGYDYYGGFSHNAGPVSPLLSSETWGPESIEASVNYYLAQGMAPKKLIVGLPYYGAEWQTESLTIPSKSSKFISHPAYSIIKHKYIDSLKVPVVYDSLSESSYAAFMDSDSTYRQIWFSDSLSLANKYDWVIAKGLGGAGIWALGYDSGDLELWELLYQKFGKKKD